MSNDKDVWDDITEPSSAPTLIPSIAPPTERNLEALTEAPPPDAENEDERDTILPPLSSMLLRALRGLSTQV